MPWIALAAGFTLGGVYAVHLHFRAETHTMTLDEILLVIGFFVAAPLHLLAAQLVGALLVFAVYRRLSLLKIVFNVSQLALGTTAGLAVFRALADPARPLAERSWMAALVACVVASMIALAAIAIAIVVTEGRTEACAFAASFGLGLAGTLVNTMLGLVVIVVLSESAFGWVLLAGPIVVVFLAYPRVPLGTLEELGLEFLYAASEVLNSAVDLEDGLIGLLDFARDTFHADLAEIVVQTDAAHRRGVPNRGRSRPDDRAPRRGRHDDRRADFSTRRWMPARRSPRTRRCSRRSVTVRVRAAPCSSPAVVRHRKPSPRTSSGCSRRSRTISARRSRRCA